MHSDSAKGKARAQLGSAASRIFHFHGLFIAASVAARVEQQLA